MGWRSFTWLNFWRNVCMGVLMKAFPQKYPIDASEPHHWVDNPLDRGMDLRDYFAAKAMQGMATWDIQRMDKLATDFGEDPCVYLAENAYQIADAMIKARKK
jgi:hypothetical protein